MTDQTTDQTRRPQPQPIKRQVMWETNTRHPEQGIQRVEAVLYPARNDPAYRQQLEEEGEPYYPLQWETETEDTLCIYPAREDGAWVVTHDGSTQIFPTAREAAVACVRRLHERIARFQKVLEELRLTWLYTPPDTGQ